MIFKILIVILILLGLFLYFIVHISARNLDDDMQRRLDEEQIKIVSEIEKKTKK